MTSQEEKESQPSLQTSRGKGGKGLGKGKAAEWAAGREERERHQAAIEAGESEDSMVYTDSDEDERLSNERDEFDRQQADPKYLEYLLKTKTYQYDQKTLSAARKGLPVLPRHPYLRDSRMQCGCCGTRALDLWHLQGDDYFQTSSGGIPFCSETCRKGGN
ncbi:MAG TPA: hypothetical protein VJ327_03130 [Patescibacteria group bacterium]|nr:hypothetical protein [Patescibacteria group bacterium]